jgi:hypothetical protein
LAVTTETVLDERLTLAIMLLHPLAVIGANVASLPIGIFHGEL